MEGEKMSVVVVVEVVHVVVNAHLQQCLNLLQFTREREGTISFHYFVAASSSIENGMKIHNYQSGRKYE